MPFTGQAEATIDAKQRLAIPSELRSRLVLDLHGQGFYLIMGPNNALWLWPEKTFERMAEELEPSLMPGAAMMEFDEVMFPDARHLVIDKTGRIRIPDDMLEDAGICKEVVVLGVRNHIELRDPAEWAQMRQQRAAKRAAIYERARAQTLGQQEGKESQA